MTQSCHHLHESTNELGASHSCVLGFGLFCFCCLVLCFVWFLFCVSLLFAWFMMVTAQWTMTGPSPVLFCGPQQ